MHTEYILWGFNAHHLEPIKLNGGSLGECRYRQIDRRMEGWTTAIYATGTVPVGLRLQARGD